MLDDDIFHCDGDGDGDGQGYERGAEMLDDDIVQLSIVKAASLSLSLIPRLWPHCQYLDASSLI